MSKIVLQRTGNPDSDDRELKDVSDNPSCWIGATYGEDDTIGKKMLRDYLEKRKCQK